MVGSNILSFMSKYTFPVISTIFVCLISTSTCQVSVCLAEIVKVGERKPVYQLEILPEEHLFVTISGTVQGIC